MSTPAKRHKTLLAALTVATLAGAQTPTLAPDAPTRWLSLCPTERPVADVSHSAYRFAEEEERADDYATVGCSVALSDGTVVWTHGYAAEGATSMSVILADVTLPDGGSLMVSNPSGDEAYEVRPAAGRYTPSEIVTGDSIILQYSGPAGASFSVCRVCKGFAPVPSSQNRDLRRSPGSYGSSTYCEVPASCLEGHDGPRRATCRIIVNNSTLGSATLVNNTAEDFAPYILTAAHVVGRAEKYTTVKALFGFEEPLCTPDGIYDHDSETITGGTLVCYDETSDMALIRLSATPSAASRAYWAGWNIGEPTTPVACFHHPYGDAKKVSTATNVATATYRGGVTASGYDFRQQFHWYVNQWDNGVTESGSSGSGLFDVDDLLVGALTGGNSTCANPTADYYWQLTKAWPIKSKDYASLSETLDPQGTGAQTLRGLGIRTENAELHFFNNYTSDAVASDVDKILVANMTISQEMPLPETETGISIKSLRLTAKSVTCYNTSDNGPHVTVSLLNANSDVMASASQKLSAFATDKVTEFTFSPAVAIAAGVGCVAVQVSTSGLDSDEAFIPLCSEIEARSAWHDGDNVSMGDGLLMSVAYTSGTSTDGITKTKSDGASCEVRKDGERITITGDGVLSVTAFDRAGRIVGQTAGRAVSQQKTNVSLSTSGWPSGIYVLRIEKTDDIENCKIIKL